MKFFEVECAGETVVIIPQIDLIEFSLQQINDDAQQILRMLDPTSSKNVVLDFQKTTYVCSDALGFFVKLWSWVRKGNGKMALCNVSSHEKKIFQVTRLDTLWPVCTSRSDALDAVRAG